VEFIFAVEKNSAKLRKFLTIKLSIKLSWTLSLNVVRQEEIFGHPPERTSIRFVRAQQPITRKKSIKISGIAYC